MNAQDSVAGGAGDVRVKICGLGEPEHARVAIDAGADLLGMIFADAPRRVSLAQARAIRAVVGPRTELFEAAPAAFGAAIVGAGRPLLVGVFARQTADEINRIVTEVDLDLVQLSGGEHPALVGRITRPVIRVIHVGPEARAETVLADAARPPLSFTTLDAESMQGGGLGRSFDWSLAAAVARGRPIILAGGLRPDNVARAILQVRPWGVDVSSGVETEGVKEPEKIRAFLAAAKAAARAAAEAGGTP